MSVKPRVSVSFSMCPNACVWVCVWVCGAEISEHSGKHGIISTKHTYGKTQRIFAENPKNRIAYGIHQTAVANRKLWGKLCHISVVRVFHKAHTKHTRFESRVELWLAKFDLVSLWLVSLVPIPYALFISANNILESVEKWLNLLRSVRILSSIH